MRNPVDTGDPTTPGGDWVPPGIARLFEVVLDAAARGRLDHDERQLFFAAGSTAADAGSTLGDLIDAYLSGAGQLWEQVFAEASESGRTIELGRALREISETAVASLADGFEAAQRRSIRADLAERQQLIDALLSPQPIDRAWFERVATRISFPRAASFVVAVAAGEPSFVDGGPVHTRVHRHLEQRYPRRGWVSAALQGRLVVIAGDTRPGEVEVLERILATESPGPWRIGIGEPVDELDAVFRSYEQAAEAVRLAERFDLATTVRHHDLLLERLLAADQTVVEALHSRVVEPLESAPRASLLDTLVAFVEGNGNMADVARRLSIGTRTVGYRLDRIAEVTGYSPREADGRLMLELAVRSRRLATSAAPPAG